MVTPVLLPEVEAPLSAGLPALVLPEGVLPEVLVSPEVLPFWVESPLEPLPVPKAGSPATVDVHAHSPTTRQRWVMFGASVRKADSHDPKVQARMVGE